MSIVGDILKAAIERQQASHVQHMADVQAKCEAANEQLRKSPLETKLEMAKDVVKFVKEVTTEPEEKKPE